MSVYSYKATVNNDVSANTLEQTELYLYGSSRLGSLTVNRNAEASVQATDTAYTLPSGFIGGLKAPYLTGLWQYELGNHLGNVLVTISDKKIGVSSNGTSIDYYVADVVSASDYYPGGMTMPGRKYQAGSSSYRYSINGQEKESELNENITTALYWEYDARIVRRWNIDPVLKVEESPYLCFSGNPIFLSDPNGDDSRTGNPKGDRSLKKYERKFNRLKEKMLRQNSNTTDANVHSAMEKYNNKKWMWVRAKSGSHDSEQGDGNNNHPMYWHIGDVYRLNNGERPATTTTNTINLVPSPSSQYVAGAPNRLTFSNTYNIPGNVSGSATVSFTANNNTVENITYSLVQGRSDILSQRTLDGTIPLASAANVAPGAIVGLPPVTVDPRQGRAISVIMQVNTHVGGWGSIGSSAIGTVSFQTVTQLTYYTVRGQMGSNRMPNSQSPDGNRNPFRLNAKTMEFLNNRRKLGVHE